jgi:hypothetical protein
MYQGIDASCHRRIVTRGPNIWDMRSSIFVVVGGGVGFGVAGAVGNVVVVGGGGGGVFDAFRAVVVGSGVVCCCLW